MSFVKNCLEYIFVDVVRDSINARSDTSQKGGGQGGLHLILPPMRAFGLMTLLPVSCYPLAALHGYGFLRCLATGTTPEFLSRADRYEKDILAHIVFKREYNSDTKKYTEVQLGQANDEEAFARALQVAGASRNQFIGDPDRKNVAYYVQDRVTLKDGQTFKIERYAFAFSSDCSRFLVPMVMAYGFHPAARRFSLDMILYFQGRLKAGQIRHPIRSFMSSIEESRRAKIRRNTVDGVPRGAKPWHYKV